MVITPGEGEYRALQTLALSGDSFDGADQGLLNQYYAYRPWHRISFTYNCTPNAEYQWEPAYRYHKSDIKMVHFIGKDKPWTKGRYFKSGKGIYNELNARWWAVYDRHLKYPVSLRKRYKYQRPSNAEEFQTQQYVPGGSSAPPATTVRLYVAGEATDMYGGVSPEEQLPPAAATEVAPLVASQPKTDYHAVKVEPPSTGIGEHGHTDPQPAAEVRSFSAPYADWDATRLVVSRNVLPVTPDFNSRSAPPVESKPEAANFPTREYTFSDSKELFHAPTQYPEPPKDMFYQIPGEKPKPQEPPKPIFPWEREGHRPRPTRVFAEDVSLPPVPPTPQPTSTISAEEELKSITSGITATYLSDDLTLQPFHPQPNAWDNVNSIERYVRAVLDAQTRRGSKQLSQQQPEEILSPSGRRESLILTDFPTADDRPSLPVTPAPIRRPTFWGDERDEAGELPPAEGVPEQVDWVCPQCGFSASSPIAFYRERRKSSAAASATPMPRPGAKRTSTGEVPALPQHLRPHRPSVTSEASTSAISTGSTAVPSVHSMPTTSPVKFQPAPSPPAVPSAVASLRRTSRTSVHDQPVERPGNVLLDPPLPTSDHAPTPPPTFFKREGSDAWDNLS